MALFGDLRNRKLTGRMLPRTPAPCGKRGGVLLLGGIFGAQAVASGVWVRLTTSSGHFNLCAQQTQVSGPEFRGDANVALSAASRAHH
jgi:hypothetical protein